MAHANAFMTGRGAEEVEKTGNGAECLAGNEDATWEFGRGGGGGKSRRCLRV